MVGWLVERGANPKERTDDGCTALAMACYRARSVAKIELVRQLIGYGVSLDQSSEHGETPVSVCYLQGDFETLRVLLAAGADPAPLFWSDAHRAVVCGTLPELERSVQTPDAANQVDARFGLSPFLLTAKCGRFDACDLLRSRGADCSKTDQHGTTALHFAAKADAPDVVRSLLAAGLPVDGRDDFGRTPLFAAAEFDACAAADALLSAGADARAATQVSSEPVHQASSLQMLRLLSEKGGADIEAIDGCGEWPLKSFAERNDLAAVAWLLSRGAAVDRTSTGATALHAAVQVDAREAMQLLLDAGADPNARDVDGWTPLFFAQSREVIALLRKHGADVGVADQAGMTLRDWLTDPLLLEALT